MKILRYASNLGNMTMTLYKGLLGGALTDHDIKSYLPKEALYSLFSSMGEGSIIVSFGQIPIWKEK